MPYERFSYGEMLRKWEVGQASPEEEIKLFQELADYMDENPVDSEHMLTLPQLARMNELMKEHKIYFNTTNPDYTHMNRPLAQVKNTLKKLIAYGSGQAYINELENGDDYKFKYWRNIFKEMQMAGIKDVASAIDKAKQLRILNDNLYKDFKKGTGDVFTIFSQVWEDAKKYEQTPFEDAKRSFESSSDIRAIKKTLQKLVTSSDIDFSAWEGDGVDEETDALNMQKLISSGDVWSLQGSYGRSAMEYLEAGICMLGKEPKQDYYGNRVPSRTEVEAGSKGSEALCKQSHPELYKKYIKLGL